MSPAVPEKPTLEGLEATLALLQPPAESTPKAAGSSRHASAAAGTVDASILARMRDTMAHRGPDGADSYLSRDCKLGLAHRRLVFFLVLRVFQVAVGPFEIRLVFGYLLFKFGSLGMQPIARTLNFAYGKGVLFKLLFDFGTPLVCCFDCFF